MSDPHNDDVPRVIAIGRRQLMKSAASVAAGVAARSTDLAAQARSTPTVMFAHVDAVLALAVAGGSVLLSGSRDRRVKFWQLADRALIDGISAHEDAVNAVAVSLDERIFASASADKSVKLWSMTEKKALARLSLDNAVHALAFSPDGKSLAAGGADRHIRIWHVPLWAVASVEQAWAVAVSGDVFAVAIDRTGAVVFGGEAGGRISAWSLADGSASRPAVQAHGGDVRAIATSADGRFVASGAADNQIRVWTCPGLEPVATLRGHRGAVRALAFTTDGSQLVSGSADETIRTWSVPEGRAIRTFTGHTAAVNTVLVAPDGRHVVSGSDDKSIRIWSLNGSQPQVSLIDLEASPASAQGIRYQRLDAQGNTVTYTMPCGSPIPANAVCICNCVAGSWSAPRTSSPGTVITGHYWYPN